MSRAIDRRYSDSLHRDAGWALGRCAPMQKHLASALDVDASWVSRQVNAERKGPTGRFFEDVARLMRSRRVLARELQRRVRER